MIVTKYLRWKTSGGIHRRRSCWQNSSETPRENRLKASFKNARIKGHRPVIATHSFTHRNLVACIVAAAAGRSNRDSSRESLGSSLEICAHHRPETDDLHQIPSHEEIWWNASSPLLLEDPTETLRESCWKAPLKYMRIKGHRPMICAESTSLEGSWWHASSPLLLEDSSENPRINQTPSLEEIQLHNLSPCWKIQPRLVARTG